MGPVAWFRELVERRGRELRTRSFTELQALAGSPTEHVAIGSRTGTISIIVEPETDGRVTPMASDEFYGYD